METLGARVVGQVFVRDHHRFSRRDLRRAAATRPDLMLCTEKDLARMRWCEEAAVLTALVCRTEILRGAGRLDRALAGLQVGQG